MTINKSIYIIELKEGKVLLAKTEEYKSSLCSNEWCTSVKFKGLSIAGYWATLSSEAIEMICPWMVINQYLNKVYG